jgi:hypothetical protein
MPPTPDTAPDTERATIPAPPPADEPTEPTNARPWDDINAELDGLIADCKAGRITPNMLATLAFLAGRRSAREVVS